MNRFDALSEQLKVMQQAGLEDSPVYQRIATMALEAAPDSLKSEIMDKAVQEGRLPLTSDCPTTRSSFPLKNSNRNAAQSRR